MTRMMETMLKHIIVFGVGSASKDFLSAAPDHLVVVALMDNDQTKHGTTVEGYKVVSPEQLARLDYDYIVVTARAVDSIRAGLMERGVPEEKIVAYCPSYSRELHERANRDIRVLNEQLGMTIPPLGLATMYVDLADSEEGFDSLPRDFVRNHAFRLAARRITDLGIKGAIGELGVYQGDQASLLNTLFPDRKLYLFDTFTGFSEKDLETEQGNGFSSAQVGDFVNTSVDLVMKKMAHPAKVRIVQGYFPESLQDLDDTFAFVSLDVDLYQPISAGLEWFYDRLSRGGYIFVHDYNNRRYRGVRSAVDEFVKARGACAVPLPDFAGSMIITK